MSGRLVLGTRGSELARTQAHLVETALREKWSDLDIETRVVRTTGDEQIGVIDERAGRKGAFTGEIERALVNGDVDLAIHSAKDLPSELTSETEISAVLPRAGVEDILVSLQRCDLDSLPRNGTVATGSVRRKRQLHWTRPDLEVVEVRGNVPTRLRKLSSNGWGAIILARAGVERLGLETNGESMTFEGTNFFGQILPREIFLPAGGQGVIAVQTRIADDSAKMLVEPINDFDTWMSLRAEREFLRLLHGDCNQPVGVLATIEGSQMRLRAQVFDDNVPTPREAEVTGRLEDAESLAASLFAAISQKSLP